MLTARLPPHLQLEHGLLRVAVDVGDGGARHQVEQAQQQVGRLAQNVVGLAAVRLRQGPAALEVSGRLGTQEKRQHEDGQGWREGASLAGGEAGYEQRHGARHTDLRALQLSPHKAPRLAPNPPAQPPHLELPVVLRVLAPHGINHLLA